MANTPTPSEKYTGSYWKWAFKDSDYWKFFIVGFGIWIGALIGTQDWAAMFFGIPASLMVYMSYSHWKEMKNGTSS